MLSGDFRASKHRSLRPVFHQNLTTMCRVQLVVLAVLTVLLTTGPSLSWARATSNGLDLTYSDLLALNKSCSPKDTCVREFSKSRDLISLNDRNCACDSVCLVYGDCCIDAPARLTQSANTSLKTEGWVCRNLTQFGGIIMKSTCPSTWVGAPEVKAKCEAEEVSDQAADPISVMPVTNRLTGTTYVNYHCAFCNGDTAETLIWLPRLEFDTLDQYNRTFQNLTGEYVQKNLEYMKDVQSWGIRLQGEDGYFYPYQAKLYPVIPQEVEGLVRPCRKSLISSCDSTWFDADVEAKCLAYEAAIYLHDLRNQGFRNAHCALCNYVDIEKLVCKPPAAKSEVEQRTFNFQAFSLIVDFNGAKGGQVGREVLCHEGEIYDPFQKTCRSVACGFPGYVLVNNKCVLRKRPKTTTPTIATTTTTTSTTTLAPTTTTSTTTTTEPPLPELTDSPIDTTTTFIEDVTTPEDPINYDTNSTDDSVHVVTLPDNETLPNTTTDSSNRDSKSDTKTANMRDVTEDPDPSTYYSQDFIECPKIVVLPDNVRALPNGTIYVIPYDKYYDPFEYLFTGSQIQVCVFFINDTQTEQAKFSIVLGYMTVVGLSISMLCLLLHLIVFVMVTDMQNLSTRNLSSLALSLFFAYFCFTIGNISTLSKLSCVTLAVTTCYFFLVSFFWMNTMSYDVWRTLKLATQELRVSSGKQWKRFLLYCFYSWGVPTVIVAIAVVADNVDGVPEDFKPGFGDRICWFSERKALLIFFATPLIAIMAANIGFFVSSAKMILSTTHSTSNNYSASPRRNFKLYLRLGVMMGLTWAFGLIAGYLDLETLWYVFVILNTLQGLFIFVAFTCNRKVRKYFGDKFRAIRKGRNAYRTSSLNSGSGFNSNSTFPSSNNSGKTMSSHLNETKTTFTSPVTMTSPMTTKPMMSPMTSPMTTTPNSSLTSFKHLQAGMETLY